MTSDSYLDYDGCRLHFAVRGAGPAVVLIQGVGVHGDGWRPQVNALADRYTCLSFDNRGIGRSQPAPKHLTVAQMAADARALTTALGWTSFHLVGHSLGGPVAIQVALAAPDKVRSLSLLCTFARGRDVGTSMRMIWIGTRTRLGSRAMRRAAFLEILAPPSALAGADRARMAAELAPLIGHDLADHPPVEDRQLAALRAFDATGDLSRLAGIPTLVVSAEHDPIAPPPLGEALARGIPGARYAMLPDAAHGVPILTPDRINGLLVEHFGRAVSC